MKPIVVIITGLSGSGKSVALRALEDEGFFCVDNLPVALMESFVAIITENNHNSRIGIGIDIREKEFLSSFDLVLKSLREKYLLEVIFLEAEKDILMRRFKETRRPHPLVADTVGIDAAIEQEMHKLSLIKREADRVIDTSSYTPHQLRHTIASFFRATARDSALSITLISFGYKFGIPQNADLLFDVRFIPNPHFVPDLKALSGTDAAVRDFVLGKPATMEFLTKTALLLNFLIPQYVREGKSYLTIGFGCTGGRHRSPAIAEKMATLIKDNPVDISVVHRDIMALVS